MDLDRLHVIPRKLKKYTYVYTAGSQEVVRYFLLSLDTIVEFDGRKLTLKDFYELENPLKSLLRIPGIRSHRINRIAPNDPSELAELILTSQIVSPTNSNGNPPELRKNYEVVKRFTEDELDELERLVQ